MTEPATFFQTESPPAPPAEATPPPQPTVPLETAAMGVPTFGDLPDNETSAPHEGLFQDPPEAAPAEDTAPAEAAPEPVEEPTESELQKENRELRELNERIEKRRADAESGFTWERQTRIQAEALANAQAIRDQQMLQAQQAAAALAEPVIPDPDALLTDPPSIQRALREYGDWGYRRALAEVAPYIGQMQAVAGVMPGILQQSADAAWSQARDMAQADDPDKFDAEVFDARREDAYRMAEDPNYNVQQQWAWKTNPVAMKEAVRLADTRMGKPKPVKAQSKTPAATPRGEGARTAGSTGGVPKELAHFEKMFGTKFDKGTIEQFKQEKAAKGGRR